MFLDTCFSTFPNKEKYFIDLSGKGEPLLFLNKILAIKRYCDQVSNKLNREVLVQFVCNGTLLNPLVANILQNNGILFGVSLDGNEYIHDFCIEVDNRKKIDKKLDIFLKKHLEYNFIEGKKIYDKDNWNTQPTWYDPFKSSDNMYFCTERTFLIWPNC